MAKVGFHKGSSGSPFHTEYYGPTGIDMGPGGKPSDPAPRVGSGVLGRKVSAEWNRGPRGGSMSSRRDSDSDSE